MRNPFAVRRTSSVPAPRGVPAPDVMAGMEFLDTPRPALADRQNAAPDVAVCGIDPQVPGRPTTPKVGLAVRGSSDRPRPDSVAELFALGASDVVVRRVTLDVRPFRDVLEARGGWNLLAQLVRDPADRVTNDVFRAAVLESPPGGPVEGGDVDCDVSIVGEGDTVAGRCRHELGRARLSITPFLAASERLTRRLAEAMARPRDRAVRRCLEHALADAIAELTARESGLPMLLAAPSDAPWCAVPGQWAPAGGTAAVASVPALATAPESTPLGRGRVVSAV